MNPNGSALDVLALEFPGDANPQTALFPPPSPSPWVFVEQPVQDVLRLARPVETRWPVGGVL